jgi:hypothetical protein
LLATDSKPWDSRFLPGRQRGVALSAASRPQDLECVRRAVVWDEQVIVSVARDDVAADLGGRELGGDGRGEADGAEVGANAQGDAGEEVVINQPAPSAPGCRSTGVRPSSS